ncbi:MAG: SpaA isopeptide-forming pilin-related protein, partial [Candidatus Bathyarchaeota archaeon]|nr:SpaA isopeptide-forming pilin-related protein [Candidatus Bathyarchaeota archaeon]
VTVKYKDALNQEVTKTASWTVDILHPSIDVIKTANATMIHPGDWVKYNVTVVNTGDCDLTVTLSDTALGISWNGTLKPGEKHEEIKSIQPKDDPTKNTASATGKDALGKEVSDSATWTVDILNPSISISKTGPAYAHEGDKITYTITVENTGDCPLYNVVVKDSLLGTIYSNGLKVGEKKTFEVKYTVPKPSEDITNNVEAKGEDALGMEVSDSASWTVDILHPAITVTKTANATEAYAGDAIKYTIVVKNTGDCPLYNVNVTDTLLGVLLTNGYLNVGANITFTYTYTVEAKSPYTLKNVVTVSGRDVLGMKVSKSAEWSIDVDVKLPPAEISAKICGYKFYDIDMDGVWDSNEPPVRDFRIRLYNGNGAFIRETTTGSNGYYCFDGLNAGTYIVEEVLSNNWVNTTSKSVKVTLNSGEVKVNFGNVCLRQGYGGAPPCYWTSAGNKLIDKNDVAHLNKLVCLYKPYSCSRCASTCCVRVRFSYPPFSGNIATARSQIRLYLLRANAKCLDWTLSANLIRAILNVRHGYLDNSTIVYVGPSKYVLRDFISISGIIEEAYNSLCSGNRDAQAYWNNILGVLNNRKLSSKLRFVCPKPCNIRY